MHTYIVNLKMIYRRTLNIEYAIIRRSISNKKKNHPLKRSLKITHLFT